MIGELITNRLLTSVVRVRMTITLSQCHFPYPLRLTHVTLLKRTKATEGQKSIT